MKIKKKGNYLFVLKAAIVWNIVDTVNKPKTIHLFKINLKYYITAALEFCHQINKRMGRGFVKPTVQYFLVYHFYRFHWSYQN